MTDHDDSLLDKAKRALGMGDERRHDEGVDPGADRHPADDTTGEGRAGTSDRDPGAGGTHDRDPGAGGTYDRDPSRGAGEEDVTTERRETGI